MKKMRHWEKFLGPGSGKGAEASNVSSAGFLKNGNDRNMEI